MHWFALQVPVNYLFAIFKIDRIYETMVHPLTTRPIAMLLWRMMLRNLSSVTILRIRY
jgi:hypothetical protein